MSNREDRVGEAVAWYFQAAESGTPPDRTDFLARFPDLGPELESFLADKGAFDRAAGPPAPARHDPDATLPPANPNNDTATLPPADPDATIPRADSNPGAAANPDPSLGSIRYFGDYELLSEIARGGMGVVFRARQVSLNREVALKMILTGQLASSADVVRFRAEAEAAANLDHPNILPIYEVGEHQGQQYFAMKLVPGGSLAGKVGPWVGESRTAVGVFVKVCRAVDFAHRRGILHRDLKPGNILLDADGTPYVTDFGLAKKVDGDSNLTQSGAIVGTPSYMAPEQARAEKGLTTAADVYALGAILYELLTGQPPFRGPTVLDTILQVIEKEPADPRSVNPRADRDLSVIALKCLEKNPTKRYESAGALADDLDRWARGEPILAREVTRRERAVKWVKRNPVVAGAAAAVFLSLLVGATVGYLNYRDARIQEGIARTSAEAAEREATEAKRQKRIADEKAADAAREATEATLQKGIAQTETQRAKDTANDLAAQLKETRRVHDLSRLREAQAAFENNQVQMARDKLAEIAPENRCLVWGLLNRRFEGSVLTLRGHAMGSVSLSGDGSRVVTVPKWDRSARVWDARTGQFLTELKGPKGPVSCAAVSADGSRTVTGTWDGTARVWDARTGQLLTELKGHTQARWNAAFSADESRVVTGADETARVWDTRTGQLVAELKGQTGWVMCVALAADGSRVVTGAWDGVARVWDVRTGRVLTELKGHALDVKSVALSVDGLRVVTGSADSTARVWDPRTGRLVSELRGHNGWVNSVAISADGSRVVTGSHDDTARVWDARTGQLLAELKGHAQPVTSVAVSADGARAVTGSDDGTVRVWDARGGQPFVEHKGHTQPVTSVAVSADGARMVTGSWDRTPRVWDARTGRLSAELKGHTDRVWSVALARDGSRVVTGSNDTTARVWDAWTGQPLLELKGHAQPVTSVAVSADGARVVTGSEDKTARVWDARTGQLLHVLKGHTARVTSVALSGDGSRVVTGGFDLTRVWDTGTGQSVAELKGILVSSVAVSADGARVVTGSSDNTARVWDIRTGQVHTLKGHTGWVTSVALSTDGARVVTGSWDNTARVWDAGTGQFLTELKGHTNIVTSVALSGDGLRVITGSNDTTARVWDSATGKRPQSEPLRPMAGSENRTPDGADASIPSGDRVLKVPARTDEDEHLRRLWLTRPDPDWNARRQKELRSEGNTHGAAVQRWAEHRARGTLALEAGDLDRAWGHFIAAAALTPAVPAPPEIVPPAPATIPRAK